MSIFAPSGDRIYPSNESIFEPIVWFTSNNTAVCFPVLNEYLTTRWPSLLILAYWSVPAMGLIPLKRSAAKVPSWMAFKVIRSVEWMFEVAMNSVIIPKMIFFILLDFLMLMIAKIGNFAYFCK